MHSVFCCLFVANCPLQSHCSDGPQLSVTVLYRQPYINAWQHTATPSNDLVLTEHTTSAAISPVFASLLKPVSECMCVRDTFYILVHKLLFVSACMCERERLGERESVLERDNEQNNLSDCLVLN